MKKFYVQTITLFQGYKKCHTDFGKLYPANNKVYSAVNSYPHGDDHVNVLP